MAAARRLKIVSPLMVAPARNNASGTTVTGLLIARAIALRRSPDGRCRMLRKREAKLIAERCFRKNARR
jgi:hypothetical protein